MDFVAIDFETANEKRSSPCAVGVLVIRDGRCAEKGLSSYPPAGTLFAPYNTAIHGIRAEDVKDAPQFCEIWGDLRCHLDGRLVLAHNAAFDMSVLRSTLDVYGIPYPELRYHCTMLIARKTWPGLPSYRLGYISARLGIEFDHHKAIDDAFACAEVFKLACQEEKATSIAELAARLGMEFGSLFPGGYVSARVACDCRARGTRCDNCTPREILPSSNGFNPAHPLYGRTVVFTGTLESMVRDEAMQRVVGVGGHCGTSVTKATDYLVVGCPDFRTFSHGCTKSAKLRKAEELAAQGSGIEIVSEFDLLKMLAAPD